MRGMNTGCSITTSTIMFLLQKDMVVYDYEGSDDKSFDKDFERTVEFYGLTWHPWVGVRFASSENLGVGV